MAWVIQQPHSNTNVSDFFRVVEYRHWLEYCDGERKSIPVIKEFELYEDAREFVLAEKYPELLN